MKFDPTQRCRARDAIWFDRAMPAHFCRRMTALLSNAKAEWAENSTSSRGRMRLLFVPAASHRNQLFASPVFFKIGFRIWMLA